MRNGISESNSGGNCSQPNICTGCNNGFYSAGPHCRSMYTTQVVLYCRLDKQIICFKIIARSATHNFLRPMNTNVNKNHRCVVCYF